MQTTGCLMGDEYYICGKEGIYQFNLMTKEIKLIVPMDLRDCTRVEIQSLTVEGHKFWGMIYTQIAENCHTNIMLLDESWKMMEQMELPYEVSGIEWGESSAVISSVLKEQLAMSFIDFKVFSCCDLTELVNISVRQQLLEDLSESHRRDQWEQEENQWVYLRRSKEYLFVGTDVFFREK